MSAICIFHQIFIGYVQKSLDLSKKTSNRHLIFAKLMRSEQKIHQIVTGIFKKFVGICKNPVDLHQKSPKSAWISSNLAESHQLWLRSHLDLLEYCQTCITSVRSSGSGFGEENPPLDPPTSGLRSGNPSPTVGVVGSGGLLGLVGFRVGLDTPRES